MFKLCELCQCEAVSVCAQDELRFCSEHGASHLARRPAHRLRRLGSSDAMGDDGEQHQDDAFCNIHEGEPYVFFCVEDQVPICKVCDRVSHHLHKAMSLKDAVLTMIQPRLSDQLTQIHSELMAEAQMGHKVNDEAEIAQVLDDIGEYFRELNQILTQEKLRVLKEVVHMTDFIKSERTRRPEQLAEKLQKVEHLMSILQGSFKPVELLQASCEAERLLLATSTDAQTTSFNRTILEFQRPKDVEKLCRNLSGVVVRAQVHSERVPSSPLVVHEHSNVMDEMKQDPVAEDSSSKIYQLFPDSMRMTNLLEMSNAEGIVRCLGESEGEFLITLPRFNEGVHKWTIQLLEGASLIIGVCATDLLDYKVSNESERIQAASYLWCLNGDAPGSRNCGYLGQPFPGHSMFQASPSTVITMKYDAHKQALYVILPGDSDRELLIGTRIPPAGVSAVFQFWEKSTVRITCLH
eukprot:TRINITY_DN5571_c0_g1_i1.p1 TRINITY_DN5571_c0_g1~~TRINITY_DN5571_c0_g1_i1.p1  ORF type:complete len:465 (-),score=102.62 TRINITY_DN5571_c0_g1_i1:1031-2425(-)